MKEIVKAIKNAVTKKGEKQSVVVDGKNVFIIAKETAFLDNPLKITITTKIIKETSIEAGKRLYQIFNNLDFIVQGKSQYCDCRIYMPADGDGFAEKSTARGNFMAMFVALERRGKWLNY